MLQAVPPPAIHTFLPGGPFRVEAQRAAKHHTARGVRPWWSATPPFAVDERYVSAWRSMVESEVRSHTREF